ncbi:protein of unknown function [Tenacibaculum sp. 190524A02b]
MKSNILLLLIEKHNLSGGHCGLYVSDLPGERNKIKKELNDLYIKNQITIHDGIHGKLIKFKSNIQCSQTI